MRILEVMECTIGGTRRHLVDLASGLCGAGDEVHLAVSALRMPSFREDLTFLESLGCTVHEIPMVRSIAPGTDWKQRHQLESLLRKVQPDVVHTHSSKAGVLGRGASLTTGIGVRVHTPHTFAFLFDAMFSAPKRYLFRRIEAHYARRTHRLIAVSEGEAETMISSGVVSAAGVRVVPNGIDMNLWGNIKPVCRESIGVPKDAIMVLVAGLLNSAKGQDLAIQALSQARLQNLFLVLAGHGDELVALERLSATLGVADRVRFLGWRSDVPALVAAADIVLLPSRWEGMPYVVLEAMASGKPVLATKVDGARELILPGETGFLVDVQDTAAMAAGLDQLALLSPQTRANYGERGAARIRAGYQIDHMVRATQEVFAEALG
jgi:glycosyltransferase involved in cell wall biosynthesis